jgi:hypothetical protein
VGVIKDAVQTLIIALQGLVTALFWIGIVIIPISLVIGLPLYFIVRGLRAWRRRRKVKRSESVE